MICIDMIVLSYQWGKRECDMLSTKFWTRLPWLSAGPNES